MADVVNMNEQSAVNQNAKSITERRASEWKITEVGDGSQEKLEPEKIGERRNSARIAKRKQEEEESKEIGPPTKKRGRPPKKTKEANGNENLSKTGNNEGMGTAATVQQDADSNSNPDNGFDVGIKAKCQLTKLIMGFFDNFESNPDHKNLYSARCTFCDEHQDRIKYVKGKNTNLISHLKRVNILLCLNFYKKKLFQYFDSIF